MRNLVHADFRARFELPWSEPFRKRRLGAAHERERGRLEDVIAGNAAWCVVHGDALDIPRDLPDGCVDACVADLPASGGGALRGDRVKLTTAKYVSKKKGQILAFADDVRDEHSFTLWTALWSSEA